MTGILNKFYVEHGVQGARVLARSHQLSAGCSSDEEVDANIQMLKDDLDACGKEMKRLLKVNRSVVIFAGMHDIHCEPAAFTACRFSVLEGYREG